MLTFLIPHYYCNKLVYDCILFLSDCNKIELSVNLNGLSDYWYGSYSNIWLQLFIVNFICEFVLLLLLCEFVVRCLLDLEKSKPNDVDDYNIYGFFNILLLTYY